MNTPDVVVLVPGFLGFARFGGFYYFADRVASVLRGHLEEALGYPVPVVPCTTLPTDPLSSRQRILLDSLRVLCTEKLSGVARIHLVGHSTGGVDAQLLGSTTAIDGTPWSSTDEGIRKRIRSVMTISSPHYGTGLADSSVARWAEDPLRHPGALPAVGTALIRLLALVPRDAAATAGVELALPNDVLKFLWQVFNNRRLIHDLRPASMEHLRSILCPDPAVSLTCFVTGTVPRHGTRPSDPLFVDLYELTKTADGASQPSAVVRKCVRRLEAFLDAPSSPIVRGAQSELPSPVDAALNDGIVNSARQILDPDEPSQIGAFVVADHADVLGHYDRMDEFVDGPPINAGLFHSGAGFGDGPFFELYRLVARAILKAIR